MNLFKLAFKNIRKSSKDYSVYFMTIVIGVAIFYMFNSVGSQSFMATITASKNASLQGLVRIIEIISVGVAIVLGGLITYANNFLIKRRKKEFGVYMMLGMSEKKVSRILSAETLIVGAVSLAAGLVLGIFGSQFLSIIVGKTFEADLSSYSFSFSFATVIKTIVYFAIIFLAVLIFNARTLSKYRLIDLLNAQKKAEKKLIKNSKFAFVLFIISILMLGFYRVEIGFRGNVQSRPEFVAAIVACLLGTILFFVSLAGFLPGMLKKFKGFYYNGLNSFVCTQFGHNLNTSALAFAIISLMLFVAICTFSVGFSVNGYFNNKLKNATPTDISMKCCGQSVSKVLKDNGYEVTDLLLNPVEMTIYETSDITLKSPLEPVFDKAQQTFPLAKWDKRELVVRLSEYNKLEELYKREPLVLREDQFAIVGDFDLINDLINESIEKNVTIKVGEDSMTSAYKSTLQEFVVMSGTTASLGVIVVPDEVIDGNIDRFVTNGSVLAGAYKREDTAAICYEIINGLDLDVYSQLISSKEEIHDKSLSTSISVVFVVLYIGVIFIITSAAVIAIKILSDCMDSVGKFDTAMKIGAESKQRKKALFFQLLLNFGAPFVLGLVNSFFALRFTKHFFIAIGLRRMFNGTAVAVIAILVVYGIYFAATYSVCSKIVINDKA